MGISTATTVLLAVAMAASAGCATKPTTATVRAPAPSPASAKPVQSQAVDSGQANADDDRKVCVLQKTLGSNHKERICRTAKQAREEREAARGQLDRVQSGRGN